jgi:DNA mismatch endonuclease (patch repair protein)
VVLDKPRRRADIVFPGLRLAVFVDGCFWHSCPEHGVGPKNNAEWWTKKLNRNTERDRETDALLKLQGWLTLRFWEHQDPDEVTAAISAVVADLRRRR